MSKNHKRGKSHRFIVVTSLLVLFAVLFNDQFANAAVTGNFGQAEQNQSPVRGKGTIHVCVMYANMDHETYTNKSGLPNGSFEITLSKRKNSSKKIVSNVSFETATFEPNTKVLGNVNDAQCQTFNNLKFGKYYYNEEQGVGSPWLTPLYNDKLETVENTRSFYVYKFVGFENDPRADRADGVLNLKRSAPEQTIIIFNWFSLETQH
ncbi:hypothetical protein KW783_00625 [Candidatus Parcubacteria bacterium]|nr:hypothetical protein [Candidatus Parcubacteria bacterium]